ncbi:multicopper oxidase domain-containing protein, partial [Kineosporia sp. A_224]|uniref:multicopper oxidase domain-containing protein n=1 Tax=Kineosporia sp. A_224 TaxID=1962180 RepID=UPI00130464CD
MTDVSTNHGRVSRRTMLRLGAAGTAATGMAAAKIIATPDLADKGWLNRNGLFEAAAVAWSDSVYIENFPTSPLILEPFKDALTIPKAAKPTPASTWKSWAESPRKDKQASSPDSTHQMWCDETPGATPGLEPIVYEFDLLVRGHSFTSSKVLPIDSAGNPTVSFDSNGASYPAGTVRTLPQSTIYGFNGTFPGPMVNAEYGKPVVIRFRNRLDENPWGLDRQDFGAPDWSFLTHLHNAHTAPESDGNPHYTMNYGPRYQGYRPGEWCDNLYLNWPAGGDDREKQSFFW